MEILPFPRTQPRKELALACLRSLLAKTDEQRNGWWAAQVERLSAELRAAGVSEEMIDRRIGEFHAEVTARLNRPSAGALTGHDTGPEAA